MSHQLYGNAESIKEYLEKNDFKINQLGALKVFSPDFKAGTSETGPDYVEVITNPTTSSGEIFSHRIQPNNINFSRCLGVLVDTIYDYYDSIDSGCNRNSYNSTSSTKTKKTTSYNRVLGLFLDLSADVGDRRTIIFKLTLFL